MFAVTVAQLAGRIRALLESDPLLTDVWVSGEISNLSRPASGHCYFTLKDESAQLRCALFRQRAQVSSLAALQHGAQVLAHGYISIYEARGDLQFYVDAVQPAGVGVLQAEFERLFAALEADGLFAPERKRQLPVFPRRIGIVTSSSGAVLHDICKVLGRRWPLVELILAPTQVQGDGAAAGVVAAIEGLNDRGNVDLIIVARGGGSLEDLWAFNEESVARAVYASRSPIVSAIGHETDFTIADYVADLRAPTPSAAAEMIVPDQIEIAVRVGGLAQALSSTIRQTLDDCRASVDEARRMLQWRQPDPGHLSGQVALLVQKLKRQTAHELALRRERLDGRERQLVALSPNGTLARGYAFVQSADGKIIASASAVRPGEQVHIRLADGGFGARVEPNGVAARAAKREPVDAQQTRLL